jgi:prevent-host-death family protein
MKTSNDQAESVTAGEVSRNFGHWQERAVVAPVVVTNHGRPRVVMVSAELYAALNTQDEQPQNPERDIALSAVLANTDEPFLALDRDFRVTAMNAPLEALLNINIGLARGRSWTEILPGAAQAFIGEQLRRVLLTGDVVDFEADAGPVGGRVCSFRAFPYPTGVAILIVNRTEERRLRRRLDEAVAFRMALAGLHDVATVRLNTRGAIVDVDDHFVALTGFELEALRGARLTDIALPRERRELGLAMERVLQAGATATVPATLLVKDGAERPIELSLAAIMREGFPGGLVAVIHPRAG